MVLFLSFCEGVGKVAVHMVLAVEDQQYIEALLDYVRGSEFSRELQITAFSKLDAFKEYWTTDGTGKRCDFIAGEKAFLSWWKEESLDDTLRWICLSEGSGEKADAPILTKYQPLNELIEGFMELGRRGDGTPVPPGAGRLPGVPVIGIYSAIGGSGKTTVGLQLAKQMASEGARVFYLDLKTFSSSAAASEQGNTAGTGGSGGMAGLLYELESGAERDVLPATSVAHYAVRHPYVRCDTFPPVSNWKELMQMEKADMVRLIDYVADSGHYDLVIAVTDAYPDGRAAGIFERCDRLVWLLLDEEEAWTRTSACMNHWKQEDEALYSVVIAKTIRVLNRYSGDVSTPGISAELAPALGLVEVAEWRKGNRSAVMADTPVYQRDVLKLCRRLFQQERSSHDGWSGSVIA
jgi:hypothetical protein